MTIHDTLGHAHSGATPQSLEHYELACADFRRYINDPLAGAQKALAASPEMTMAHVLVAYLNLLGTEPAGIEVARGCCAAAAALDADARERGHLEAAQALAAGRWQAAALRLEDINARYPRDLLALQVGHQIDFFRGDARMLRDRIARALPAWEPSMPGWHAVLGMHAFGLEETGDYAAAEAQGRRSVELEPRDSWGWHAVAHVHEMRNAPHDGIAWLEPTRATWSNASFLGTHNAWHLALCQLELDRHDEVLRLYDEAIGGTGSAVVLDLIDASAMLWRLHLRGVALGARGAAIAERWAAHGAGGNYAFNDLHAMIAYVLADRPREQQALLDAQQATMQSDLDNAGFTRDVGHPASLAVQAFGAGDFDRAAALLRPIRSIAHRFGGSHAQRDLIDLTLLAAADRAGDSALAAALAAERAALRPNSPDARRIAARWRIPSLG